MPIDYSLLSKSLVDVAMGRRSADLVIRNGQWVNVQSGEIMEHTDIAVKGERVAYVGADASHTIDKYTTFIDADGRYLEPGFLDAHMHIESGMVTVTEFVRAVLPHGTTGMIVDPPEITNVFGLKGVRLMVDEAKVQPIHVWVQVPSCVPFAPGFETPGASIDPDDVAEAMSWDGIIGLGEMMNFPGVFLNDAKMHREMAEARKAGKVVGGHYASFDLSLPFHGYVAGSHEDDHEGTRLEDAVARVRQGMKVMMREGSAWHDVDEQVRAITEMGLDPRNFILCVDDSHSETLVNDGHVNLAVRRAIARGLRPITAIQMATINTAEHFDISREIGTIAPSKYADTLLIRDLPSARPALVIAKGQIVAQEGLIQIDIPAFEYPDWAIDSVHIARPLKANDFLLAVPDPTSKHVAANVIGIIENQAPTRHLRMELQVQNGSVQIDRDQDLAMVARVERHQGIRQIQVGLVSGFGFSEKCAVGSTVAHDSHHMIVVGTDENAMATAANELARAEGGQVVVKNDEVIGLVELPIAGLMSLEPTDIVAQKAAKVLEGFRACGCELNNPNMQLSLLALVVIPELRISDKGLIDVTKFDFIPVLES